ncbi:MAG: hypothetical protein QXI43_00060 [Candidatus Nitrosocaldus sp.]
MRKRRERRRGRNKLMSASSDTFTSYRVNRLLYLLAYPPHPHPPLTTTAITIATAVAASTIAITTTNNS